MKYMGYFVDDDEDEAPAFAMLLSSKGENSVSFSNTPLQNATELSNTIFNTQPDIVALDFRLDEKLGALNPQQTFKGSGLAQLLRDKAMANQDKDFPIVLVSAEDKFEHFYRPDSTAHDLFDRTYVKEQVSQSKEKVRNELISLCDGYALLKRNWARKDYCVIFDISAEEGEILHTQELRHILNEPAAPHIVARAILRNLIDRSGFLLSDNEIAARLGVSPSNMTELVGCLTDASILYTGIFSGGWRRWWAHRFDIWAETIFGRRSTSVPGSERVRIIKERLGVDLPSANSTWNRSPHEKFAFACASCGNPTEVRHSLSAFDPGVPRFVHRRRICWDCIQTEKYIDRRLSVDDVDARLVEEVKNRSREPGDNQH